jgi:Skp family chaperone for outer membrane proteins
MSLSKTALPVIAMALGAIATFAFLPSSTAQQPGPSGPARIGIANPAKVFNDMAETRDLKSRLENERKTLEETEKSKRGRLQQLQDDLRLLRADSPQFADKQRELRQAAVEFQVWGQMMQAEVQQNQKMQMRLLYDKILAATTVVASAKGYDLVIADQRPEIPENLDQINVDQLRVLINSRNVLFATPGVDLTADVTVEVDRAYRAAAPVAPR